MILIAFDFDHTIVDGNTDVKVPEEALKNNHVAYE